MFLLKSPVKWLPLDYHSWLYSRHYQIYDKVTRSGIQACQRDEQLNYLVGYLYFQVQNGGLWQYFFNPCGPDAPDLLLALEEIGAYRLGRVIREACSFFPDGRPTGSFEERDASMGKIDERVAASLENKVQKLVGPFTLPTYVMARLRATWLRYLLGPGQDLLPLLRAACARHEAKS